MFTTICASCIAENAEKAQAILGAELVTAAAPGQVEMTRAQLGQTARNVLLTTEAILPGAEVERLGVVTGTCIYGQHVGRDIVAALTDFVGGRATGIEKLFAEARTAALDDMRTEAARLGADTILALQISHQEMSAGGKSMVMVFATGTAVKSGSRCPLN